MSTLLLDMPGKFDGWFSDSSLRHGKDLEADGRRAAWEAYHGAQRVTRGKGYTLRLTIHPDTAPDVLLCLREYAEACLAANSDEPDSAEVAAARTFLRRIEALEKSLGIEYEWTTWGQMQSGG